MDLDTVVLSNVLSNTEQKRLFMLKKSFRLNFIQGMIYGFKTDQGEAMRNHWPLETMVVIAYEWLTSCPVLLA